MLVYFHTPPSQKITGMASADVFQCPTPGGKTVYQDVPCSETAAPLIARAQAALQPGVTLLPTFPPGPTYSYSLFEYQTTETRRTRLPIIPDDALVATCLAQYRGLLNDPRSPYVQDAALTERVWKSSKGDVRRGLEVMLDARAKNKFGGYVAQVFTCPLTDDAATIEPQGMEAHIAAFRLGIPIK
jgi:hypothetical protein